MEEMSAMLERLEELIAEAEELKKKAYSECASQREKESPEEKLSEEYERKCRRDENAYCLLAELENVKKFYLKLTEPEE